MDNDDKLDELIDMLAKDFHLMDATDSEDVRELRRAAIRLAIQDYADGARA